MDCGRRGLQIHGSVQAEIGGHFSGQLRWEIQHSARSLPSIHIHWKPLCAQHCAHRNEKDVVLALGKL